MRSGWVGLIRAKAETVRSRERGADGSSLFSGRPRRERDDVVGGIEEHLKDVITFADQHGVG
jgi:hypothetical protein